MRTSHLFLFLSIVGIILPYSQMIPFVQANGMDMVLLFSKLFENRAVAFFGFDLLVTVAAFFVFVIVEQRRQRIPGTWMAIAGVFLIGASFGFPFYLYLRERVREQQA